MATPILIPSSANPHITQAFSQGSSEAAFGTMDSTSMDSVFWTVGGIAAIAAISGAAAFTCSRTTSANCPKTIAQGALSCDSADNISNKPDAAALSEQIAMLQQRVEALRRSVEECEISLSEAGSTMAYILQDMRKVSQEHHVAVGKKERAKLLSLSTQAVQSVALALQVEFVQLAPQLDDLKWEVPISRSRAWWTEGTVGLGRLAGLMDMLHRHPEGSCRSSVPGLVHAIFAGLEDNYRFKKSDEADTAFSPLLHCGRSASKPLFDCLAYTLVVLLRSQAEFFHAGTRAVPFPKLWAQSVSTSTPEMRSLRGGPENAAKLHSLDVGVHRTNIASCRLEGLPKKIRDALVQPTNDRRFEIVGVDYE